MWIFLALELQLTDLTAKTVLWENLGSNPDH
jgi:hypothetical protein